MKWWYMKMEMLNDDFKRECWYVCKVGGEE